jgi:hypothetical protein
MAGAIKRGTPLPSESTVLSSLVKELEIFLVVPGRAFRAGELG